MVSCSVIGIVVLLTSETSLGGEMELRNLENLKILIGRIFTGKERNVQYRLLSICWTKPAEMSICEVEKWHNRATGLKVKLTMTASEFLKSVDKCEY